MASLLEATTISVNALAKEGRLPREQAELLRALLLRESQAKTSEIGRQGGGHCVRQSAAADGKAVAVEEAKGRGWAALPDVVERGIFTALQDTLRYRGDNAAAARLVCREWKRAVTRHFTSAYCPYTMSDMARLWTAKMKERFPTATNLTLDGSTFLSEGGVGLRHIAAAYGADLEHLRVEQLDVSEGDIRELAQHATSIKHLMLSSHFESKAGRDLSGILDAISGMPSLTSLDIGQLTGRLLDNFALLGLQSLVRLEKLSCSLDMEDALPEIVPQLTRLRELTLRAHMPPRHLHAISALQHLETLELHAPGNLLELMPVVAPIKSLRKLRLTRPDRGDGSRARMDAMYGEEDGEPQDGLLPVAQQVTHLDIFSTDVGEGVMKYLARALPGLVQLELEDSHCLAADLPHLQGIAGLRELYIGQGWTSDAVVRGALPEPGLKGFPALQNLYFSGVNGSELLPTGDISLLVPHTLLDLQLGFTTPGIHQPAEIDPDDFLRAVRAAPSLNTIELENVLHLAPYTDPDDDEEAIDLPAAAPDLESVYDMRERLFEAVPGLKHLDIDDHFWTRQPASGCVT